MKFLPQLVLILATAVAVGADTRPLAPVSSIPSQIALRVSEAAEGGGVSLVANGKASDIYCDPADFRVVQIAAECLAADVERATGVKPSVKADATSVSQQSVIVGTLGKGGLIDRLARTGKIKAQSIVGRWESFLIATVREPFPGVDSALVIAGSDRRGTAYGVFTLSEAIGVSPWVWWADVPVSRRNALAVGVTDLLSGPPSVKYRGVFINDEDWGLQPWAAKTFEPETKDIGPKTYARVFELLLRLKANHLWPAMHPSTKAFNHYPRNKEIAEDYAIVMGSSHAEPMLRNNVDEWDQKAFGPWDYTRNRERVLGYWNERVASNAKFENIYTLGMRGIHDSQMVGQKTVAERVAAMEDIFREQRAMLAKHVNPKAEQVPQSFVPYKEVLELYRNGLKVPEDATLVWVDDNHGYLRQLSNAAERKRGGGAGVYYHLSYWGAPEDYLWTESISPALIWEEMHKSYENGADRIWVANVGDIKPTEIGMEFFLRMAWDISPWKETSQMTFLTDWSERTFGKKHAKEIASVLDEYFRLNFPAKPEHVHRAKFSDHYGERTQRLERFSALVAKTEALAAELSPEFQDAFYELVLFKVRGAALVNRMHLGADHAEALKAYGLIQTETARYNETVAGGKWRHMMSPNPRDRPALRKPVEPKQAAPPQPVAPAHSGGYLAFEAEHPTRSTAGKETAWKVIPGLGRSGDSIALLPTTAPAAAALEYDFDLPHDADVTAVIYALPTHPVHSGVQARYSVTVDRGEEQTFLIAAAEYSKEWGENVLRSASIRTARPIRLPRGKHSLKLRPLDPGLVFDKIVLDLGGLQPSHLGPPATPLSR